MSINNGPTLSSIYSAATESVFKVSTYLFIKTYRLKALIDSGSTDRSFISHKVPKRLKLKKHTSSGLIHMATGVQTTKTAGYCVVDLLRREYRNINLNIINDLCTDVILGTDFQEQQESGGNKPTLTFCALTTIHANPLTLFANLSANYKPIASKPERFSKPHQQFIDSETLWLLKEGMIEPSLFLWKAQTLVVKEDGNHSEGQHYQFTRMTFGVTNRTACFQRKMDEFLKKHELQDTYAFVENLIICGTTMVKV